MHHWSKAWWDIAIFQDKCLGRESRCIPMRNLCLFFNHTWSLTQDLAKPHAPCRQHVPHLPWLYTGSELGRIYSWAIIDRKWDRFFCFLLSPGTMLLLMGVGFGFFLCFFFLFLHARQPLIAKTSDYNIPPPPKVSVEMISQMLLFGPSILYILLTGYTYLWTVVHALPRKPRIPRKSRKPIRKT